MNKKALKPLNTSNRQGEEAWSPTGSCVRLVKAIKDIIQKWSRGVEHSKNRAPPKCVRLRLEFLSQICHRLS